ncbi:class I SAM-dependent methyltransferase [Ferruginibacter sp. SUN106]|uniref:class I SAM-dependent methyltransferase n=1 Tax=Ferruginibacter sp. SUN106 TaxID=2978348 RepID=UPI003D36465C
MRKKLRKILPPAIYALLEKMYRAKLIMQSKSKINRLLKSKEDIFLEIGAGEKKGSNGWVTLDYGHKCDLVWDLRKGIPFPDNSIEKIYSSHLFEHLPYPAIESLLTECKRVLKSNGVFSICVPNARLFIEAYTNKDETFAAKNQPVYDLGFNNTGSLIDWVNYIAYMGIEHKYMFDENNMINILTKMGLRNARIREFDSSIDLQARLRDSLYAEAIK